MKRLLVLIVLSISLLLACTKPLDDIIILQIKDKQDSSTVSTFDTKQPSYDTSAYLPIETSESHVITSAPDAGDTQRELIINKSSKKIHLSEDCSYAAKISEKNKVKAPFSEIDSYIQNGYDICSYCESHF